MKLLDKLNKDVEKLIFNIIKTKRGGNKNRPARKITGKLLKTKPIIKFDGKEISIDLDAVEYYQYLDEGTRKITKPFFYTKELIDSKEFYELLNDFFYKYYKEEIEEIWQ